MQQRNADRGPVAGMAVAGALLALLWGAGPGAAQTTDADQRLRRSVSLGDGGAASGEAPSRIKAMGASLLLPGWGQLMAGHPQRARLFLTAEAGILAGYVTFRVQGRIRKERYISYAERFAGAGNLDGKEDWYYRNLGQYSSSDAYADEIARGARAMFGDDLEERQAYLEKYRPGPDEEWEWQSEAQRIEYREKRKASRNAYRHADHMLGIAILNRVLSAVDVAILLRRGGQSHRLYVTGEPDGTSRLGLAWRF